jgi:hypothetical protein
MRPEDVVFSASRPGDDDVIAIEGTVAKVTYAGREAFYRLDGEGGLQILAHVARPDSGHLAVVGERLHVEIPIARLHAFDAVDGRRIELRP